VGGRNESTVINRRKVQKIKYRPEIGDRVKFPHNWRSEGPKHTRTHMTNRHPYTHHTHIHRHSRGDYFSPTFNFQTFHIPKKSIFTEGWGAHKTVLHVRSRNFIYGVRFQQESALIKILPQLWTGMQ
jgi:hypothetical protein